MAERRMPRGLLDPESEAIAEAYEASPAVRRQLRGLLDVVQRAFSLEPQEQTAGDTALDIAGGFVPGVSQAMALRDIERARRAGDPAGMAMAATEFVPFGRLVQQFDPVMSRIKAYHGTASDFDVFDPAMGGSSTGAQSARDATWFVDDPRVARGYATYAAEDAPVQAKLLEAEKLEKIAQRTGKQSDWEKYDNALLEAENLEKTAYDRRSQLAKLLEVDIPDDTDFMVLDAKGMTPAQLSKNEDIDSWLNKQLKAAKRQGKAGVKIKNLDDAAGISNAPATHFALFDPTGVKIVDKQKLVK